MSSGPKVNMPASYGGLTRVSETESKVLLTPETIMVIIGAVILIELLLHSGSLTF